MITETSSSIICQAFGLKPEGDSASHSDDCVFCGMHIAKGDLYTPFEVNPFFTDAQSFANKGGDMTCGFCSVLLTVDYLRATGYGVFSAAGVQPFRKWVAVAQALQSPPHGPFVMTYATANNQHMAWRSPVNYSRDLFYVRVGLRDLKIRRPVLLKAVETAQRMGVAIGRSPTAKTLAHPYIGLSPDLKDHNTGYLPQNVWEKCDPKDIQEIMSLTTGELWAMRFILSPGAGTEQPIE